MKYIYLLLLFLSFVRNASAQIEPALPSGCLSRGKDADNNLTVTGNTTFTFTNLADFDNTQALNNITVTVKSSQGYRLYIAGEMTSIIGSSTNTSIPINTFSISATNRGTSPATVTLSGSYLEIAQNSAKTTGTSHVLTITRSALNTFTQAPGIHTLTLHLRYCQ